MLCSQCGNQYQQSANFCAICGKQGVISALAVPPLSEISQQFPESSGLTASPYAPPLSPAAAEPLPVASAPRPWIRYWARMLDVYLACIAAGVAIGFVYPEAFTAESSDQVFAIVVIFLWIFVESVLLATVGTTPGKWLLNTSIVPAAGGRMDFSSALSRSFKVWWRGLGIGFPIASLITLLVAHNNLTKNSITSWDKDEGTVVVHGKIGALRVVSVVLLFAGVLFLMVLGTVAST